MARSASSEGPTVLLAWSAFHEKDWNTIAELDAEVTALRPSAAARRASRAMGLRLAGTWQALYPDAGLAVLVARARDGTLGPALPVAFAAVCASSGHRSANLGGGVRLQSPRGDGFGGDAPDASRADRGAPPAGRDTGARA